MTIPEIQDSIISEFALYDDWLDKYAYIIELGKDCPLIDEKDKTENNLIKGCQSRVWLSCEHRDGRLWFKADSDAVITKGIITLLIRAFNGQTPKDILDADLGFIDINVVYQPQVVDVDWDFRVIDVFHAVDYGVFDGFFCRGHI